MISMRRLRLIVSTFVFISVILVSRTAAPYPGWYDPTTQRGIKPGIPIFIRNKKLNGGIYGAVQQQQRIVYGIGMTKDMAI